MERNMLMLIHFHMTLDRTLIDTWLDQAVFLGFFVRWIDVASITNQSFRRRLTYRTQST